MRNPPTNFSAKRLRPTCGAKTPDLRNRITKAQGEVSGCFCSQEGVDIFCRVQSCISACREQDFLVAEAFALLFQKKLPDYISEPAGRANSL